MEKEIQKIAADFKKALQNTQVLTELEDLRVRYLGKKGHLTQCIKQLQNLPLAERAKAGKTVNTVKQSLQELLTQQQLNLKQQQFKTSLQQEWLDLTATQNTEETGSLHPTTIVQSELEDIFSAMGFQIWDGLHIETEYYNFEALNIPKDHPARDMQDTFFFGDGWLLRAHTSTIQVRAMEVSKPPLRVIAPGKVFRAERLDAAHECCFHQLEGMLIDKNISVANLIYFMETMLSEVLKTETKIRLRPGYFPFVEPGFEVDIQCSICQGQGCAVCKKVGWIELLGCGMMRPNVLKMSGIDPEIYTGFAFGMGIDRLVMMKYGIKDIRLLHSGRLDFHQQFAEVTAKKIKV